MARTRASSFLTVLTEVVDSRFLPFCENDVSMPRPLQKVHALHQLYHLALLQSRLVETLDVQFSAIAHKERNPYYIQGVAYDKYCKYEHIVISKNGKVNYKVDEREYNAHTIGKQEVLDTTMFTDALQNVASHARVEELQRHGGKLIRKSAMSWMSMREFIWSINHERM